MSNPKQSKLSSNPPDSPQPAKLASLTEQIIEVIDNFASEKRLDPQLLMDATARAVSNINTELQARLRKFEDDQRRYAFELAFQQRKADFQTAVSVSKEPPYIVKRAWVSQGLHIVQVEGYRESIFELKEVK